MRRNLTIALCSIVSAVALTAATVPSAHAERSPGIDATDVIDVCPFPIEVHEGYQSFNEMFLPHAIQDTASATRSTSPTQTRGPPGTSRATPSATGSTTRTVR